MLEEPTQLQEPALGYSLLNSIGYLWLYHTVDLRRQRSSSTKSRSLRGAAEAPLSPLTSGAFDFICTMSRSHPSIACRPFDRGRDGFVMGEGAASLVLEEYEHATTRT